MHPIERVRLICSRNGLTLTEHQAEALRAYGDLLIAWNRKLNLISRRDEEDLWFAHILHSLSVWFFLRIPAKSTVLDLGSGGGLPGVPLAILRSDLRLVLLDSVKKKTVALEAITRELGLANVEVRTGRAEERSFQQTFRCNVVIARAVAALEDLVRWSRPLLVSSSHEPRAAGEVASGTLIALKGGELEGEIRAARVKGGAVSIDVRDLVFDGSHEAGLVDKKVILVGLG